MASPWFLQAFVILDIRGSMKLLIIGSGGREHALAWKAQASKKVESIYVAPGNAGTAREPKTENIDIDPLDFEALIQFAKNNSIDLTIVGPEAPLAAGIKDAFEKQGLSCFAPSQKAAQLESSKSFAKEFLIKNHIPTALAQTFDDFEEAKTYLETQTYPVVIKADGLCAGKGVVIAQNQDQAIETLDMMLNDRLYQEASSKVVIEEFMMGEEASYIILTDGENFAPFDTSQDHKARDNHDQGPNTGGMGAYSPAPVVDKALHQEIINIIVEPTLSGLKQEGISYNGFLYIGLMITSAGPKVLEFNCRLGDPEAQVLLMRLESDLITLIDDCLNQRLAESQLSWYQGSALGVVMAAHGYPANVRTGDLISGLNDLPGTSNQKIFHAGVQHQEGQMVTHGGRILCVCARASTIVSAQEQAYQWVKKVQIPGSFFRDDIGYKAIQRALSHA